MLGRMHVYGCKKINRTIGLMTTNFLTIHFGCTVTQAVEVFRDAQEKVKGSYVFILDAQDALMGYISLSSLLRFSPGEIISELLVEKVVAVRERDSQEKIARLIFKYKLEAIPVVDERRRILGIVTFWEALDYLLPQSWKKKSIDEEILSSSTR